MSSFIGSMNAYSRRQPRPVSSKLSRGMNTHYGYNSLSPDAPENDPMNMDDLGEQNNPPVQSGFYPNFTRNFDTHFGSQGRIFLSTLFFIFCRYPFFSKYSCLYGRCFAHAHV
jgi:hypothetical protein